MSPLSPRTSKGTWNASWFLSEKVERHTWGQKSDPILIIEVQVPLWNVITHGRDKQMNGSFHEFDRDPLSRTSMTGGIVTSSLRNKSKHIPLSLPPFYRSVHLWSQPDDEAVDGVPSRIKSKKYRESRFRRTIPADASETILLRMD